MKNALIFALLFLTSGAFIGLIVDESFNLSSASAGDEHAQIMWGVIDCIVITICFFHGRSSFFHFVQDTNLNILSIIDLRRA